MTAVLPDARPDNWVDRHAPAALRPWLKLGRFDRPIGIWLLMLPGWQGIALEAMSRQQLPNPALLVLFAIGAAVMRATGCAYNDIVDRDFDARVARTAMRPIPSGQISVRQAWAFTAACCLVGLAILLCLNLWAVALGVASLALVAAYPFMKRITWWPQAWLGLTFNWGIPMGFAAGLGGAPAWAALAGAAAWPAANGNLAAAVILYAGAVFWTLGYDTIYAAQDMEDDALVGVKSSARRMGARAPLGVLIFYVIAFALALAAAALAGAQPLFWPLAALYGLSLSRQAQRFDPADGQAALKLFRSNTLSGLLLFAGLCIGSFPAHLQWPG
jgi:4-hydroxybenzoate polyprenyltransferase